MGLTVVYLETAAPGLRRLKQKDEPALRRATRAILYQVDEGGKTIYVINVSVVS
jgi:hypothetical protein